MESHGSHHQEGNYGQNHCDYGRARAGWPVLLDESVCPIIYDKHSAAQLVERLGGVDAEYQSVGWRRADGRVTDRLSG